MLVIMVKRMVIVPLVFLSPQHQGGASIIHDPCRRLPLIHLTIGKQSPRAVHVLFMTCKTHSWYSSAPSSALLRGRLNNASFPTTAKIHVTLTWPLRGRSVPRRSIAAAYSRYLQNSLRAEKRSVVNE